MNTLLKTTYVLALAALLLAPVVVNAQERPAGNAATPELAMTYDWIHSNAPPGGCGCFSLNGGAVSMALPLKGRVSVVAEFTDGYASRVLNTGRSLNLSTFTAGVRYSPRAGRGGLQPFGQAQIGAAILTGASSTTANASDAFAASVGGGLDLRLSHHFSLRLVQAQYLVTTFDNFSNNHQNNVEAGAGLVFHF